MTAAPQWRVPPQRVPPACLLSTLWPSHACCARSAALAPEGSMHRSRKPAPHQAERTDCNTAWQALN